MLTFCILCCQCALRNQITSNLNKISIIYITDWSVEQSAKISNLIRNENIKAPQLVLINGKIFSNNELTKKNQGQLELEILNASGIDAVLLTPDFLLWGIDNCRELIRKSNFYCLAANIIDKTTDQPLGHQYLLKTIGKSQIALIGVSYDSLNFQSEVSQIDYRYPEFTILKLIPLVENRSDFQFVLTQFEDSLDLPVDFIIGAPMKNKPQILSTEENGIYHLEISYDNSYNIIEIKRTNLDINSLNEDPAIKSIISKYQEK